MHVRPGLKFKTKFVDFEANFGTYSTRLYCVRRSYKVKLIFFFILNQNCHHCYFYHHHQSWDRDRTGS
jgi:hypothetical protein